MSATLPPLQTLFDATSGEEVPLPPELSSVYGALRLPSHAHRAHIISNFVTTLDGVTSWNEPGQSGGGEISGFNAHDRLVMGLLRAVSDAVVVGAGTLRSVPRHVWTAEHVYPDLAEVFRGLRARLGKSPAPVNVVVTSLGRINPSWPVFTSEAPVLVVSAPAGEARLREQRAGDSLPVVIGRSGTDLTVTAGDILDAIGAGPGGMVLVEGGAHLLSDFLAERRLDELFLTLSPQIAGREAGLFRPSLAEGKRFAPADPLWSKLVSVKRNEDHLFLRYRL